MITITIGGAQRELKSQADLEENWINQQLNQRRRDGQIVCLTMRVQQSPIDVILSTPGCSSGCGGGRLPSREEERVFALWHDRGLNDSDFTGGQVIAFMRQLFRIIGW